MLDQNLIGNCSVVYGNCCVRNFPKELSKSQSDKAYDLVFDVGLVGAILIAGITGNILSFLVLARDGKKGTTSLILRSLAIFDTVFLSCCFFFQFMKTISVFTMWISYYNFNSYFTYFLYGTGMAIRMMRNWTVVLVSLERWVAVCRPLRAHTYCTRAKAWVALALIVIISLVFIIPQYLVPFVVPMKENCTGLIIAEIKFRPALRKVPYFEIAYRIVSYTILVIFLPITSLCILNILLILGVRKASRQRSAMAVPMSTTSEVVSKKGVQYTLTHAKHHSNNSEVTRLCLGVIAVYILCEIPSVVYQVIYFTRNQQAINIVRPVSNMMVSLNSGINFFIYVFLGKRFRRHLCSLLCGSTNQRSVGMNGALTHSRIPTNAKNAKNGTFSSRWDSKYQNVNFSNTAM